MEFTVYNYHKCACQWYGVNIESTEVRSGLRAAPWSPATRNCQQLRLAVVESREGPVGSEQCAIQTFGCCQRGSHYLGGGGRGWCAAAGS